MQKSAMSDERTLRHLVHSLNFQLFWPVVSGGANRTNYPLQENPEKHGF